RGINDPILLRRRAVGSPWRVRKAAADHNQVTILQGAGSLSLLCGTAAQGRRLQQEKQMRLSPLAISTAAIALAMVAPVFGQDAMSSAAMPAGEPMMMSGKTITITVENLLTGQPFSPSYFESRTADSPPLYGLGETASDA